MATVSSEAYLLHMLRRAEQSRHELNRKKAMAAELRALEFWRAIIAECLGAFVYVFLVCGAYVAWPMHSANSLTKSFAAGLAMATATHCFGPISGAHLNPALTLAMLATRRITPLRAFLYVTAQCGGAIAGSALLYGLTAPGGGVGHREHLGCTLVSESLSAWQAAGLEAAITSFVAFALFASADPNRATLGSDALAIGAAHCVCTLVALPATGASMNPARSLGPAFVTNTWSNHWVYWCGPVLGGLLSGLIYEYIFDSPRKVPTITKEKDESEKDASETRDDTDSKSSASISTRPSQVHQAGPIFRAPLEGPRPHSRGSPYAKYNQVQVPTATYYTTLPRGNNNNSVYRTWSNEYGASSQFKF